MQPVGQNQQEAPPRLNTQIPELTQCSVKETFSLHKKYHPASMEPISRKVSQKTKSKQNHQEQLQKMEEEIGALKELLTKERQRTQESSQVYENQMNSLEMQKQKATESLQILQMQNQKAAESLHALELKNNQLATSLEGQQQKLEKCKEVLKAKDDSCASLSVHLDKQRQVSQNQSQHIKAVEALFLVEQKKTATERQKFEKIIKDLQSQIRSLRSGQVAEGQQSEKKIDDLSNQINVLELALRNSSSKILEKSAELKTKLAFEDTLNIYEVGYFNRLKTKLGKLTGGQYSSWKTLDISEIFNGVALWINMEAIEPFTGKPFESLLKKTCILAIKGESDYQRWSRAFSAYDAQKLYDYIKDQAVVSAAQATNQVFHYYQISQFDPKEEKLSARWIGNSHEKDKAYYLDAYFRANQELPSGYFDLGYCYYKGRGVKKDRSQAEIYLRLAAEQKYNPPYSGIDTEQYQAATLETILGDYYESMSAHREAEKNWISAHKKDDPVALSRLAVTSRDYLNLALASAGTLATEIALIASVDGKSELVRSSVRCGTVSILTVGFTALTTVILKKLDLKKDSMYHNLPKFVAGIGSLVNAMTAWRLVSASTFIENESFLYRFVSRLDYQFLSRFGTFLSNFLLGRVMDLHAVVNFGAALATSFSSNYMISLAQRPFLKDYEDHVEKKPV